MKARELQEIEEDYDGRVNAVFESPLSTSQHADWRLWRGIFTKSLWKFEKTLEVNTNTLNNTVEQRHSSNIDWYYNEIMKFQGGQSDNGFVMDELIVDTTGKVQFANVDPSRRIISYLSLVEGEDGKLRVKAAKTNGTDIVRLEDDERLALNQYMRKIKYPGMKYLLTADNPDSLKFNIEVYHNSLSEPDLLTALDEAVGNYQETLGFNDKLYKQRFVEHLLKVPNVVTVKPISLEGKTAAQSVYQTIDVMYTISAGYFNFTPTDDATHPSVITLINVNTL